MIYFLQLAAKALPTYDNFLSFMLVDEASTEVSNEGVRAIKEDMEMCTTAMGVVITILQQYYEQGNLEIEEVVWGRTLWLCEKGMHK